MSSQIRFARPHDVPLIYQFIKDLSSYEKMEDQMVTTIEELHQALFVLRRAEVIFIDEDEHSVGFALFFHNFSTEVIFIDEDEHSVGFALFFHNFSTFVGKAGLYLEDLFVYPDYRGKGYGKSLFIFLAKLAVERGCGRVEWSCLDWNTPSIAFYQSLGATPMSDWTVYRLTESQLKKLSAST